MAYWSKSGQTLPNREGLTMKLYRVTVSTGLLRLRVYRNTYTVFSAAETEAKARMQGALFVQSRLRNQDYKARGESTEFICNTDKPMVRFSCRYATDRFISQE